MEISGFSAKALATVSSMLYAEGQTNPLEGECNQKAKRKQMKQARTPAQQEADRLRSQSNRGQNTVPSATRSEAAKKAAATRAKCKGGGASSPSPAAPTTTV